jgi:hypothetical protein
MAGHLMSADGDLIAPNINVKNIDDMLLGGVKAVDLRMSTINAKKHRRCAH